jgi:FixJ family two-component response regulator
MLSDRTVFIVDPDVEVRRSLEHLLTNAQLSARAYGTVEDFLNDPDLDDAGCLILDPRIPSTGIQKLWETFRARDLYVPVIIISPDSEVGVAIQATNLGSVDFLTKPVNPVILLPKVHEALRQDAAHKPRNAKSVAV